MKKTLTVLFLGLATVVGCFDGEPLLECDSAVVDTPDGLRLRVECNRDVEDPPAECAPQGGGVYLCNTYHANQEFCETFPGVCGA